MNAAVALPLAFSGLSLISLSMQRHAREVGLKARPRWLRGVGWAVLVLSLIAALVGPNWRFALVEWFGIAAFAASLVVLGLYWRPALLPPLALASAGLGAISAVIAVVG